MNESANGLAGVVHSVNVSPVRTIHYHGREITTGIFKEPVSSRIAVRGVNLDGDDQADRTVHGGADQAVYAYALEDYQWWEQQLGRSLPPGQFGENLTTSGIRINDALVGERWRVGTALLQVTAPRTPCYKLAMKMDDPRFIKRFALALRPGPYFSIVEEGEIQQGDAIQVVHRPSHNITIAEMTNIYLFQHDRLAELLVPELPPAWRESILSHT